MFARIGASGDAAWYLTDYQGTVHGRRGQHRHGAGPNLTYDAFGNVTGETVPMASRGYGFRGMQLKPS